MHLLRGPSVEVMGIIADDLKEDADRFEHNLGQLKKWIAYQSHLPKNYDQGILPVFLRGCKHDVERAKRKIELYYSVRRSVPELYSGRDPASPETQLACRVMNIIPLPQLTKDGCRVTVHRLVDPDANNFDVQHILRLFLMMGDIRVSEESAIAGDIYIMDGCNSIGAHHAAKLANVLVKKALTIAHEAYPQRLRRVHIVNTPAIADRLLTLIKSFMKEKLRDRFIIHRTTDSLADYISTDVLPAEYGGKAGELSALHDGWLGYLDQKRGWFKEQESVVAVGPIPRHLSHSCALDSTDNVQGSFRKLTID